MTAYPQAQQHDRPELRDDAARSPERCVALRVWAVPPRSHRNDRVPASAREALTAVVVES
jgi:hypothetical protein